VELSLNKDGDIKTKTLRETGKAAQAALRRKGYGI